MRLAGLTCHRLWRLPTAHPMDRTNRPRLAPGRVGSPLVWVPELAQAARLTLPASQLEAPAWEQALTQPSPWAVLRLAWWKRSAHSPRPPHSAARPEFWRLAVELAPAPPLQREDELQPLEPV